MLTFDNEAADQESRDSNHCYQVMWVDIEEMFNSTLTFWIPCLGTLVYFFMRTKLYISMFFFNIYVRLRV